MADDIKELWDKFSKERSKEYRDKLIENYIPLVKKIAGRISKTTNVTVEFDDLVSDGIFGLIKAINNFDVSRGIKFETYATPVVKGSILNSLRALDWVPERIRGKAREMEKAASKFACTYGREGTKQEIAALMEISASDLYELIANLGCAYLLSLNQPFSCFNNEDEIEIMDTVSDDRVVEPSMELSFSEQRDELKKALNCLPPREKLLIEYHYFKRMTFEKISPYLGVTKQRVSQIHSRALKMLREHLTKKQMDDLQGYLWY